MRRRTASPACLWTGLAGAGGELPDSALDDAGVYNRLYNTAVAQYREFEPPGDPQTPSEQHTRVTPEPGDHAPPAEDRPSTDVAYP